MNTMNTTTQISVIKIRLPMVRPLIVSSRKRVWDGRSTVALRPPLGLGRLRSRQRDRDDEGLPLWLHALLLQVADKDFRQHGRAPWLHWRFVGGVALAVQPVNGIVRSRRGGRAWPQSRATARSGRARLPAKPRNVGNGPAKVKC